MNVQQADTGRSTAFAAAAVSLLAMAAVLAGCNLQRGSAPGGNLPPQLSAKEGFFFNQDGLLSHVDGPLTVKVPRTELAALLA